MLRSILAVVLGMGVGALVFASGLLLTSWLLPAAMEAGVLPRSSIPFLAAVPVISLAAGIAGGCVTTSAAAHSPFRHARALAVAGLIWSALWIIGRGFPATTDVVWFGLAVGLCGGLGVLLGARLSHRH